MPRYQCITFLLASILAFSAGEAAFAVHGYGGGHSRVPRRPTARARYYPWHGAYAHTQYGAPVALVVPPTARLQTNWSWGTGSSRIQRVDHQFSRSWIGAGTGGGFFRTPAWPADTTHFGVYPVRAPW